MQLVLLFLLALTAEANYVFDSDIHFIFNATYNNDGAFVDLDIIFDYPWVTNLVGTAQTVNPAVGIYSADLATVFLGIDPTAYTPLVDGDSLYAVDIYHNNNCGIKFHIQLVFPSAGSHNVTFLIDGDSYFSGVNTHKQEHYVYQIPSDFMSTMNLTVDWLTYSNSTSYNIQFGYSPVAVIQNYPGFTNAFIMKYPIFFIGTEIYFPTTNLGEIYIQDFELNGMHLNIRDTFQLYTVCSESVV